MDTTNGATNSHADTTPNQTNQAPPAAVIAYATAVAQGDAPVTTLLQQHHDTQSSVAARRANVQREIDEAMARYNQAAPQYVPFRNIFSGETLCYASSPCWAVTTLWRCVVTQPPSPT
ncbi:hypothetical protein F4820DRAFT_451006 [Hypoxylon rubiginosum]|uniref:Uncharacterized protein n=1 Tax=Hypoxylon rubiginosum TaxID=110542 RepID=A0ACB9YTK1_9PEZI|nr:hypothetical protein F4820DRAFT_451006 [Hypoxylon rubiginosum]